MSTTSLPVVTDQMDTLLTSTIRNYNKTFTDVITRSQPLLYMLEQKGRKQSVNGGTKCTENIVFGNNQTIRWFNGYETLNVDPQEGLTMAEFPPYSFSGSVSISWEEEMKNKGPAAMLNLLSMKQLQLENSIRWWLNRHLHGRFGEAARTHTGRESNAKDSLGGAAVDAVGVNSIDHLIRMKQGYGASTAFNVTCGGITTSLDTDDSSTATNPWWMNSSIPGYLPLTFDGNLGAATPTATEDAWADAIDTVSATGGSNLVKVLGAAKRRMTDTNDGPDLILTTEEVAGLYEASQQIAERYTDRKLADAGFDNISYGKIPIMHDKGITVPLTASGTPVPIYMFNTKYLAWRVWSGADFFQSPFYRPHNQAARTSQTLFMGQLTVRARNRQMVIAANIA